MYDLAKVSSNEPRESAFQKKSGKKTQIPENKKAVTVRRTETTEVDCIWAVVTTAKNPNLRLINTSLRQHQWSQAGPLHLLCK